VGGSGDDQHLYAAGVGSCDSRCPEGTATVDSVFHLMGNRVRGMGCCTKHRIEAA